MEETMLVETKQTTWLFLDDDNRIVGFSYCDPSTYDDPMAEGHVIAEIDDAVFQATEHDPLEYLYIDGSLVWSPTSEQNRKNALAIAPEPERVLKEIFKSNPETLEALPDEILENMSVYMQPWEPGVAYSIGEIRHHDYLPYKCIQAHTSQLDWEPPNTPALWLRITKPGEIPEWIQPAGVHDAYAKGDHVMHNGKEWVSTIDSNVWEPGVYGWLEV